MILKRQQVQEKKDFIDILPSFLLFCLEHLSGAKRVKRTSSPISTNLYINSSDDNLESDDDDERDSLTDPTTVLTCPLCGSTYHRLSHLFKHAKRKHHLDLSNSHTTNPSDLLSAPEIDRKNADELPEIPNSNEEQGKEENLYLQ